MVKKNMVGQGSVEKMEDTMSLRRSARIKAQADSSSRGKGKMTDEMFFIPTRRSYCKNGRKRRQLEKAPIPRRKRKTSMNVGMQVIPYSNTEEEEEEEEEINQEGSEIELFKGVFLLANVASRQQHSETLAIPLDSIDGEPVIPLAFAAAGEGSNQRGTRSKITRKPRTSYTFFLTTFGIGAAALDSSEQSKEKELEEEEDLYSRVKRRTRRRRTTTMKKLMEVAEERCTRVNGKGWRCEKIARPGYSLCAHHVGGQKKKAAHCTTLSLC